MPKSPEKPKKYADRLMDVFAFDEDDLEANQVGQISAHQVDQLKSARKTLGLYWIAGTLFSSIFLIIALANAVAADSMTVAAVFALIGMAMLAGFSFYFGSGIRQINRDMREQHAAQVEGRIDLSLQKKQSDTDYSMRVDGLHIPLKQKTFLALKNGDPYRVYYVPRSKQILSVEWLRDGDDNLSAETTLLSEDEPSSAAKRG